jgi:hypothetical protein
MKRQIGARARFHAGDHQPGQQLALHRQRYDARIEMAEGDPPFLRQRAKLAGVVMKDVREFLRLDDEPFGHRRGVDRRT